MVDGERWQTLTHERWTVKDVIPWTVVERERSGTGKSRERAGFERTHVKRESNKKIRHLDNQSLQAQSCFVEFHFP